MKKVWTLIEALQEIKSSKDFPLINVDDVISIKYNNDKNKRDFVVALTDASYLVSLGINVYIKLQ